jgi:hypothetical protein
MNGRKCHLGTAGIDIQPLRLSNGGVGIYMKLIIGNDIVNSINRIYTRVNKGLESSYGMNHYRLRVLERIEGVVESQTISTPKSNFLSNYIFDFEIWQ